MSSNTNTKTTTTQTTSPRPSPPKTQPRFPPKYIYKILPLSSPYFPPLLTNNNLPATLALTPLDVASQFIHLSTSSQLLSTLNLFFASERRAYILRVRLSSVRDFVRWEDGEGRCWDFNADGGDGEGEGGEGIKGKGSGEVEGDRNRERNRFFPHIYGNDKEGLKRGELGLKFGREEVDRVGVWVRGEEVEQGQGKEDQEGSKDGSGSENGKWEGNGWPFEDEDRPLM